MTVDQKPRAHVGGKPIPSPYAVARLSYKKKTYLFTCACVCDTVIGDVAVAICHTPLLSCAVAHFYRSVSSRMSVRRENCFMFLRQAKVSVCAGGYFSRRNVAVSVCGSGLRLYCTHSYAGWLMHTKATMRSVIFSFFVVCYCVKLMRPA